MAFPGEEGELRLIRLCTGEKRTIQINICHAKKETEKKRRQQLQRQRTKKKSEEEKHFHSTKNNFHFYEKLNPLFSV